MPDLCQPCVDMLAELCRIGQDPRLCWCQVGYAVSGDPAYVELASGIAPGDLLAQAKANLKAQGRLPEGA